MRRASVNTPMNWPTLRPMPRLSWSKSAGRRNKLKRNSGLTSLRWRPYAKVTGNRLTKPVSTPPNGGDVLKAQKRPSSDSPSPENLRVARQKRQHPRRRNDARPKLAPSPNFAENKARFLCPQRVAAAVTQHGADRRGCQTSRLGYNRKPTAPVFAR